MKKRKKLAQSWIDVAKNDLLFTKAGLADTNYWAGACFGCHQVVEKSLKAFIIYNDTEPERTHHLRKLLEKCQEFDTDFERLSDICDKLNAYYAPARYPDAGIVNIYSEKEAKEALNGAEEVWNCVEEKINLK